MDETDCILIRSSSSKSTGTAASGSLSLMSGLSDIVLLDEEGETGFSITRENSGVENTENDDMMSAGNRVPVVDSSSSSSSSSGSGGIGSLLSPGGELSELVSGIDDVDRIPTNDYVDIAGIQHSSPIKGFSFGTTPDISSLTGGTPANINLTTPSSAFLRPSPSLQSTSNAEVLLSWKYKSGASGHNKPSLTDTYRMQMEGLRLERNSMTKPSKLGIAGKNKSSKHMDKKKRRPNGSSTNGDDVVGIDSEKEKSRRSPNNNSNSNKTKSKSKSKSAKAKDSKKSEEDLLWEHEMGKSDYHLYPQDQQNLHDLSQTWEKKWEDDDGHDEIDGEDDDDEDNGDNDGDDDDDADDDGDVEDDNDDDSNLDVEDDHMMMNHSVDSEGSEDSDSMASLSSGLDSVTLDALMEVGSNHSVNMNDELDSVSVDGVGDVKFISSALLPSNTSTSIQRATPVLSMNLPHVNDTSISTATIASSNADQMTLSPLTIRSSSASSVVAELKNVSKQSPSSSAAVQSSISDTVYHGKRQSMRKQVVEDDIITGGKKTNRGKYKCGRCGQSKQGHICEYVLQTDVCSTATQIQNWGLGNHPFQTEKTLTVKVREINIYNGDGNDNVGQEQQSSQLSLSVPTFPGTG